MNNLSPVRKAPVFKAPVFKDDVKRALGDATLKLAIDRTTVTAETKRAAALADYPQFAAARRRGTAIKEHVVANLGHYLEQFERNATASGAVVHWAADAEEACQIVIRLCRAAGAKQATRSKSMLGEEIGLPHALEAAGIERVETDLAEHIIQLAGETPSHIIWPALHKTREQVSALFKAHHADPHQTEDVGAMVESARRELRARFLSAEVGISGANFLLADSGAVHIVTAGIEKLVPSLPHAWTLLRLLVRSATGADLTQYTTFHTGPKRPGDRDGPQEFHIVLVDNGRSRMLRDGLRDMLRCIRCGACMNHCIVFRQIGGHAYGGTYPGPLGAVLNPALEGVEKARDLPHACTLNGRCQEVCPVSIPLPTLLRGWRDTGWREGLVPQTVRSSLWLWRFMAERPKLYRLGTAIAVRAMRLFRRGGWIGRMPLAGSWTRYRDLPAPPARTFMQQLGDRNAKAGNVKVGNAGR